MTRWEWFAAVAVVGAIGCGDKNRAAHRAALEDVKTDFAAYQACLTGKQAGDSSTALVVTLDHVGYGTLECAESTRTALLGSLAHLATQTGTKLPAPASFDHVRLADAARVCKDLGDLASSIDTLARQVAASSVAPPACDVDKLRVEVITAPHELAERMPRVWLDDGALVTSVDAKDDDSTSTGTVARYADRTWDVRAAPVRMHEFTWPASGPVAITWQDKHGDHKRTIMVDDGKRGWAPAARAAIDGVEAIAATANSRITVIGFALHRDDYTTVWRSSDRGKTIGPPVDVLGPPLTTATFVDDDGSVVSVGETYNGARARFEARRLGPTETKPTVTASLTWPEASASGASPRLCVSSRGLWVLDGRHILRSNATGASWKEVADLGADLEFPRLACSDDVLALWSRTSDDKRELRTCTPASCSAPIAVPFTSRSAVGFRFGPKLEVWLAQETQSDDPFAIMAYRVEAGGLVADRVMIAPASPSYQVGAVRDGSSFVVMHAALGSLY